MPDRIFQFPTPFIDEERTRNVTIVPLTPELLVKWVESQDEGIRSTIKDAAFKASPGQTFAFGSVVLLGIHAPLSYYDLPQAVAKIRAQFSDDFLKNASFTLEAGTLSPQEQTKACIGWAWSCYRPGLYKKNESVSPALVWPEGADKTRVKALADGVCLIRNLINTPSNDMGPEELEQAARKLAGDFKAKIKVTVDHDLKKDFPLIYTVGDSSPRRPRLIDITWGDPDHPKVTIAGKGVCFDTGGLDIKPPAAMLMMKKDMGGAANALGLALMVMTLKLPIRLRVLIPAVENSTSGVAFRPMDIYPSRKGLTVETNDTDAEGRLVLADCLTLAGEEDPDLLIDFATLTGAARVALGYDLPAFFGNRDETVDSLKDISFTEEDDLWPLPVYEPYRKELNSEIADICNIGTGRAGAIHGALFLDRFFDPSIDWLHLDMYAWEQNGKPGRPKGGADTGARAVLALLEKRYAA